MLKTKITVTIPRINDRAFRIIPAMAMPFDVVLCLRPTIPRIRPTTPVTIEIIGIKQHAKRPTIPIIMETRAMVGALS